MGKHDDYGKRVLREAFPSEFIDWGKSTEIDLGIGHPARIEYLLITLTRELGLSFAAIDLVLNQEGKYFFLEVNPSGQWLWVEDKTGLPISDAVADWLEGFDDNY
jgi:hypothetical protein